MKLKIELDWFSRKIEWQCGARSKFLAPLQGQIGQRANDARSRTAVEIRRKLRVQEHPASATESISQMVYNDGRSGHFAAAFYSPSQGIHTSVNRPCRSAALI